MQLKYRYIKKQNKDFIDLNPLSKSNNILALFFSTVIIYILLSSSCECNADASEATFRIARAAFVEEQLRRRLLNEEHTFWDVFAFNELNTQHTAALEVWSLDVSVFLGEAKGLVARAQMLVDISNEPRLGAALGVVAQ